MSDVWVVLIKDRHADIEVLPFSTEEGAITKARSWVPPEYAREEQLTPDMRKSGWVLLLSYGTEGDCVRVVKRTMDGQGRR